MLGKRREFVKNAWKEKGVCEKLIRTMPFLRSVYSLAWDVLMLFRVLLLEMWSMD